MLICLSEMLMRRIQPYLSQTREVALAVNNHISPAIAPKINPTAYQGNWVKLRERPEKSFPHCL